MLVIAGEGRRAIGAIAASAAFLLAGPAAPAAADSAVLSASRDATLIEVDGGTLANGAGSGLFVGRVGPRGGFTLRRALVAFDVAGALPAGAIVTSAELTLHVDLSTAANSDITLHAITQDWGEGTASADMLMGGGAGAPAEPGDATWLHTFTDPTTPAFWSNPGGDFDASASASQTAGSFGAVTWSSAGLLADVQAFLDAPGSNFGWLLFDDDGGARRLASRSHGDLALRPTLTLGFVVPEPATGMLAAAGLLLLGLRRR